MQSFDNGCSVNMIWASYTILILLWIVAVFEITARGLQLRSLIRPCSATFSAPCVYERIAQTPFVSIHVATYNEPPRLVIETLKYLAKISSVDFEVLIVDNNTQDARVWSPVAQAVRTLGARFKFIHIDHLSGAKAGALNVALAMTNPKSTHVAVVDADYQVDPTFLKDAVDSLSVANVDYVQFPQAYRGGTSAARGVEYELGDYFASFSRGAGRPGSMLPTGTLSVFTLSALKAVGGWPTETITEDAKIGVLLQSAGYRGLWLARERGWGLLPVDFHGLRKQRARWAAGNLQVLRSLCSDGALKLGLPFLLNLAAQLTSWISLLLPAAVALILVSLFPGFALANAIGCTAAATILASAMLTALRMIILGGANVDWKVRLEAYCTKIALTWTSALSWIPALFEHPLQFHRTSKSIKPGPRANEVVLAGVSFGFFVAGAAYLERSQFLETAACSLLASVWICARTVDANLRRAALLNPELC